MINKGDDNMKKARVILSVVAVLAVAGGAFAFKASRVISPYYSTYTTTIAGPTYCTSNTYFSVSPNAALPLVTLYRSKNTAGLCVTSFTTHATTVIE